MQCIVPLAALTIYAENANLAVTGELKGIQNCLAVMDDFAIVEKMVRSFASQMATAMAKQQMPAAARLNEDCSQLLKCAVEYIETAGEWLATDRDETTAIAQAQRQERLRLLQLGFLVAHVAQKLGGDGADDLLDPLRQITALRTRDVDQIRDVVDGQVVQAVDSLQMRLMEPCVLGTSPIR